MTPEQKEARKKSAESGNIKWIKDHCLRTMADGEDYVFISYKSDDYERALDDILYRTCRKYGLRVYFDVAFDDGSDSWIRQFYENMSDGHCKAMIAFISNKYYSSYATLMEMMARKTCAAGGDYSFDTLRLIPIILEDIKPPLDGGANTGLGTVRFKVDDGVKEIPEANVKLELERFNEIFEELLDEDKKLKPLYKGLKKAKFYKEAFPKQGLPQEGEIFLKVSQCRAIMQKVLPSFTGVDGKTKNFEDAIHDMLVTPGLGSVFIPDWKPLPFESVNPPKAVITPKPVEPPKPVVTPKPVEPPKSVDLSAEKISLPAFLKKYNNNNFKKGTFRQIRLVGQGECAAFSTPFFDSAYPLAWSFVMKLLEERGEEYLHFVNEKNAGNKNPPFITAAEHQKRKEEKHPVTYRKLELPGLEGWSMCRHYGQYGWVNDVLRRRILELGLPPEAFSLEYIPGSNEQTEEPEPINGTDASEAGGGQEDAGPAGEDMGAGPDGGIGGPVDLDGKTGKQKKKAPKKDYRFTLCGEHYHVLKLKDLMLTVFKTTLARHPDQLDLLLKNLPCLGEGIKIGPDAQPSTFRAGDTVEMSGRSISIGTSLNEAQVLSYIKKLMLLCGEPKENLVFDSCDC